MISLVGLSQPPHEGEQAGGLGAVAEVDDPALNAPANLETIADRHHEASRALGNGAGFVERFGLGHGWLRLVDG